MKDCAPAEGAPTLVGELQRGVNPFNLGFGAVATLALIVFASPFVLQSPTVAEITGPLTWQRVLWGAVALFAAITAIHTVAHATMGWVFERGLRLHCQGDFPRAYRWLFLAGQPGMDHYDPNGLALAALRDCENRLRDGSPATDRPS